MRPEQKERHTLGFSLINWVGIAIASILIGLGSLESIRDYIRTHWLVAHREILAKIDVDFTGRGERATVVKVRSLDTLSLEIYFFDQPDKAATEVKRIVLNEKRDGHFDFGGNATNLVATDVDGDGVPELVTPSFDANLIPRLNVFKFDPKDRSFSRVGPESFSSFRN